MPAFWNSHPFLVEALGRVKARLTRLSDVFPKALKGEIDPILRQEGKSLRAGLLLLSAVKTQAGKTEYFDSQRWQRIEAAAAAVETLHLATLVHDDVIDQAPTRRGDRSLFARFGAHKAILYGDLLLSACFHLVTQEVSAQSARALSQVTAAMVCSELIQYNDRFRTDLSLRSAVRKILGKTAMLFSLAMHVGAFESGKSAFECSRFRRAGYALGMAFQIQDDLLDWIGDSRQLGKPVLEDVQNGIYNWPVVVAFTIDPNQTVRSLEAVRRCEMTAEALKSQWDRIGLWKCVERDVQMYLDRAKRDLRSILEPVDFEMWEKAVDQLVNRRV